MTTSTRSSRKNGEAPVRVLFLTQWFDPEPTFKGMQFARSLRDRGFEVDVLTGFPNCPGGKLYTGYRVKPVQRELIDGIRILRVPLFPSHDRSSVRRALNYLSFAISAILVCLFIRRPDVAYVHHPPATVAIAARVLKAFRRVPYIYDVQEIWPGTLGATAMASRPGLLRVVGGLVRFAYRGAARIVVFSPSSRAALVARGVPENKVEVIGNWAYETELMMSESSPPGSGTFNIVYAGNVGMVHALEAMLDAAQLLEDAPIRFAIVGDGADLSRLRERAGKLKLDNVDFVPRQLPTEMSRIYSNTAALHGHPEYDPLFADAVPSKTQMYLKAGRPTLIGVRGTAADIVLAAGSEFFFEPESATDLARVVRQLLRLNAKEREKLGRAGRLYYERHLAPEIGVDRLAAIFRLYGGLKAPRTVLKRALDIVFAGSLLVLLSIPLAAIALVVRGSDGGPAFFRQERPGRDGVPFRIVKFRTMTDARNPGGTLLPDAERLTRIGRVLRATSLDELPELWNVLKGDMSLVGPRPLLMRYMAHFKERERLRLLVRPGITGWAQVNGRNRSSWDDRLELDARYVEDYSLMLDARILLRTVWAVLSGRGVILVPESLMQDLDTERLSRAET